MTRLRLMLVGLLPRSRLTLLFGVIGVASGAFMDPLIRSIGSGHQEWLAQWAGCNALAGLGFALGGYERWVRQWPPSLLIPGLLRARVIMDLTLIFLVWVIFIAVMLFNDSDGGIALTMSLGLGVMGLAVGSGYFGRPALIVMIVVGVGQGFEPMHEGTVALLAWPGMEIVMSLVAVVTSVILVLRHRAAPEHRRASDIDFDHVEYTSLKSRWGTFLRLVRLTPDQAFAAAFEHSRAQAWVNTMAGLFLFNSLPVLVMMARGASAHHYAIIIGTLTSLLAVLLPMTSREVFNANADFLWLTGIRETRRELSKSAFYRMLVPSLRAVAVGLVVVSTLALANESTLEFSLAVAALLAAPGNAALILLFGIVLLRERGRHGHTEAVVFGIFLLIELGVAGVGVAWLNLRLPLPVIAVAMAVCSAAVVFTCSSVATGIMVRRGHMSGAR